MLVVANIWDENRKAPVRRRCCRNIVAVSLGCALRMFVDAHGRTVQDAAWITVDPGAPVSCDVASGSRRAQRTSGLKGADMTSGRSHGVAGKPDAGEPG